MRCLGVLVASLLLAACPGTAPITGDDDPTPDAMIDPDGNVLPGNGLAITFQVDAPLPITTMNNATITRIVLRATTVRATGDAAFGDAKTTKTDYLMEWNATQSPPPIAFPEAPVGEYNEIAVSLASDNSGQGTQPALQIIGRCRSDGKDVALDIESDAPILFDIPIATTLTPGGAAEIKLHLDVNVLIGFINWDDLNVIDDEIEIDDDDNANVLSQIVSKLSLSFRQ